MGKHTTSSSAKACLASIKLMTSTKHPGNDPTGIMTMLNDLADACFTENTLNERLDVTINDIHESINLLISHTSTHINEKWIDTEEKMNSLNSIKEKFVLFTQILLNNCADLDTLNNTQRLCTVLKTKIGRLRKPITATKATHFAKPDSGIRKNENLSQVRTNLYDFDDTIYIKKSASIPDEVKQQLRILHQILKIQGFIITARNYEMDAQSFYIKNIKTGAIYAIKEENHDSICDILTEHQLDNILHPKKIIYCDFYHKVEVNHPEYKYYFDYSAENRKKSKVGDYEETINKHGLTSSQTAVFDNSQTVWPEIDKHTKNFFHVNNQSMSGSLKKYLNDEIIQLVLYGEHLRLHNRLIAAKESLALGLFRRHPKESAALQQFIHENQEKCFLEMRALSLVY